jgi:hypothetical protein
LRRVADPTATFYSLKSASPFAQNETFLGAGATRVNGWPGADFIASEAALKQPQETS